MFTVIIYTSTFSFQLFSISFENKSDCRICWRIKVSKAASRFHDFKMDSQQRYNFKTSYFVRFFKLRISNLVFDFGSSFKFYLNLSWPLCFFLWVCFVSKCPMHIECIVPIPKFGISNDEIKLKQFSNRHIKNKH